MSCVPQPCRWDRPADFSIDVGYWVIVVFDVGRLFIDPSRDQHVIWSHFDVARLGAARLTGIDINHET